MDAFWMWVKIVVACIPAVVYGLLFDDAVSEAFKKEIGTSGVTVQVIVVAVMLVLVEVRTGTRIVYLPPQHCHS